MNKRIAEVTAGGEQEFLTSRLIQDGVVRNLEVIGEATKNLNIAGKRDVLIHDDLKVNLSRVWLTVSPDLPDLRTTVTELLNQT